MFQMFAYICSEALRNQNQNSPKKTKQNDLAGAPECTVLVLRMANRIWKETKQAQLGQAVA